MNPVLVWLIGGVVAPDAYGRLVDAVNKPGFQKSIAKGVRSTTGLRVGRPYRRWVVDPSTISDLVARGQPAFDRLVDRLAWSESKGLLRSRPVDRDRATQLVSATIQHFLPTLDPGLGIEVLDRRADDRHDEVMDRLNATSSFEDRLVQIPVSARQALSSESVDRATAERIVDGIVTRPPREVLDAWFAVQPAWLFANASSHTTLCLAHLAASYGLRRESGEAFERCADLGLEPARWYARAAFDAAGSDDEERSAELLAKARACGPHNFVTIVEAALENDIEGILAATDQDEVIDDSFLAPLRAHALLWSGDADGAISYLSDCLLKNPEFANVELYLAQFLADRSANAGTTSRTADRDRALMLALASRDRRRSWQASSTEAVRLATRIALASGDLTNVLNLGRLAPDGVATAEEAADAEVQFCVAQAALGVGEHEVVERVIEESSDFRRALIEADLMSAMGADDALVANAYESCWALAEEEQEKVDFWIGASSSGVEPLPGLNELNGRTDGLPDLCRASSHIAHGRTEEACLLLKPIRTRELARRLLVSAYMQQESIDLAVSELQNMASRFDNPQHLVSAARILATAERIAEACAPADRALSLLPATHRDRSFLREIGVVAAHNRADWPDMESRARGWINEQGATARRRWLLVLAIYNQADPDGAWRVLQEDGECEPESALEAQLWIALNARFRRRSDAFSRILELAERFEGVRGVRAAAVDAFLMADDVPIDPVELPRWQQLVQDRADDPGPDDSFRMISLADGADDPMAVAEAFRPLLQGRGERIDEWVGHVQRSGWPYGVLSLGTGRTYTEALVMRAAGFFPIRTSAEEVRELEVECARRALADGRVLVDISTLATAWFVQDFWTKLSGGFDALETTPGARLDSLIASDSLESRWQGTIGWDRQADRPVATDTPIESLETMRAHTAWIRAQVLAMPVSSGSVQAPKEAADRGAWMEALAVSKLSEVALWADDLGLRNLARSEGVDCFGTTALVEALAGTELSPLELRTIINSLRSNYCVDFELDEAWLLESARATEYKAGAASLSFERPAVWLDLQESFRVWNAVAVEASSTDSSSTAVWAYAASRGLSLAFDPRVAHGLCAAVIGQSAGLVNADAEAFATCAAAVAEATTMEGHPDPIELGLQMTFDYLQLEQSASDSARELARLGAALDGDHRDALRKVLFGL